MASALRMVETAVAPVDPGATTVGHRRPEAVSYDNFRRQYDSPEAWQSQVGKRINDLCSAYERDPANALPISWDVVGFATHVLQQHMFGRTPIPQIVPTGEGGLQFEWHTHGVDLELHIAAPYNCELWFEDRQSDAEPVSQMITGDFTAFQRAIRTLTKRY